MFRKIIIFVWEIVKIVVVSLAIIIPIRYYLVQPFFVKGASMAPNFEDGEYLIIDELSYRLSGPKRGDVIIFRYPLDPSQYYIKRIIGLPGETIEIEDGKVVVSSGKNPEGVILDESNYLKEKEATPGNLKITLDTNDYFVLGDNRRASSDSRRWGALPRHMILGRVLLRAWPVERAGIFNSPYYSF